MITEIRQVRLTCPPMLVQQPSQVWPRLPRAQRWRERSSADGVIRRMQPISRRGALRASAQLVEDLDSSLCQPKAFLFDGVWIYSGEAFARIEYFPADLVHPNLLKCPAEILVWSILGYESASFSLFSTKLISCSLMILRCKDYLAVDGAMRQGLYHSITMQVRIFTVRLSVPAQSY